MHGLIVAYVGEETFVGIRVLDSINYLQDAFSGTFFESLDLLVVRNCINEILFHQAEYLRYS